MRLALDRVVRKDVAVDMRAVIGRIVRHGWMWFVAAVPAGHSAVEWERTRVEVSTAPGSPAQVVFRFRNAGQQPVTLEKIKTSCRCIAVGGMRRQYGPGEGGELPVRIAFGSDLGRFLKHIRVRTDEPGRPWYQLEAVGDVRLPVAVQPAFVWWPRGEVPQPKAVEVSATEAGPMALLRVACDNPRVRLSQEIIEPGRRYRVLIVPDSTAEIFNAAVEIETEGAAGRKTHRVFASVK